jgi:hypothetical protein
MLRSLLMLLTLCALSLFAEAVPAQQAGVRRCTMVDGTTLYTDKACADLGAVPRLPRTSDSGSRLNLYRGGCSRTLSDLVYQITSAINAEDVNRLAGVYEWSGASNASAHRTLNRLEAIVKRPLVDIIAIRPSPPPVLDEQGRLVDYNSDGYYPRTSVRQRPVGLRLEQTLANGSTPSRTVFGLRRNYNCFWITF